MSRSNAAHTLPPGDRADAPNAEAPPHASPAGSAGREAPKNGELLPGITLELDRISGSLDEAQMVLGEIKLDRGQGDWALLTSSVHRFSVLARHIENTVTQHRKRISQHAAAKKSTTKETRA